ncbi:PKD domain-containing protein [Halocalculus aciditolerans]|uniref:PKD domain-containing protein n=1 Tax=Halocalculus aciditolerans TaxID=1383812 RepID=A0A830FEZ1_9EURY|nr:PKD domain-containing protein [Halocalculus aciditolerans]GGL68109.1 hypothetical protein GCM10009039_27640 [Halocalculus aciditolerans]
MERGSVAGIFVVSILVLSAVAGVGLSAGFASDGDPPTAMNARSDGAGESVREGVEYARPAERPALGRTGGTRPATDPEDPDPSIVTVQAPDEISVGDSAIIDVYVDNEGGTAGSSSTISMSFPAFDSSRDTDRLQVRRNELTSRNIVGAGETIHTRSGDSASADYALVEGSTESNEWGSGAQKRLSVSVTPETAGTFTVYVRATLTDDGDWKTKFSAPDAGAVDQQGYVVREITIDVVEPKESISIFPEDENGEVPNDPDILLRRASDGETKSLELNARGKCTNCAWFKDSFVDPGSYRAYVKVDSNYWGWRDVTVSEGEGEYITFDRGGTWIRDIELDTDESGGNPRVAPGSEIPVTIDTYKQNHGSDVRVKLYAHEEGTSRPETPTKTISRGVSNGANTYQAELSAPYDEGTYEIDYVVETYFSEFGGYRVTDVVDGQTVRVEAYEPPQIDGSSPGTRELTVKPGETSTFSVSASDPDTASSRLDVQWFVDGTQTVSGSKFQLNPEKYSAGEHDVSVVVGDGSARTEDARASWTVSVVKPPHVTSVTPTDGTVAPGEPIEFSVRADDPNGYAITDYSWSIGGKHLVGERVSYTFGKTGTVTAEVTATNSKGVSTTKTFEVTVSGTSPDITEVGPENRTVRIGESVSFAAKAVDPAGRDVSMSYQWRIDGEDAFTTRTGSRSFTEAGTHRVTVVATNEFGMKSTESFDVKVLNDQPELSVMSPSGGAATVQSKKTVQFVGRVVNEDASNVRVNLRVDGEVIDRKDVSDSPGQVTFRTKFENPGSHSVELVGRDGHGASSSVSWDVKVTSRKPVFESWSPEVGRMTALTPSTWNFSAEARDPEGQSVTYEWSVDGSYVSDGTELRKQFTTHGEHTVSVTAIDPQGVNRTHEWAVVTKSFTVEPNVRNHATEQEVNVDNGTTTFLSVSMQNPQVNNRSAEVEFVIDLPSGVAIKRMANVHASSTGDAVGSATLRPGDEKSMRLGIFVKDESLRGESVTVDYEVRYYPSGRKGDYHSVLDQSSTIDLVGNQETQAEKANQLTVTGSPGFTVVSGLLALGVGILVALRRQ